MRKGFTLAEVLITLGIIGVVAALVMPGLIANHQKQTYVTSLKKSVSVLQNGFKLAMAEDGVDNINETELFKSIESASTKFGTQATFQKEFSRYFNVTKYVPDYNSDGYYTHLGFEFTGGAAFASPLAPAPISVMGLAAYLNNGTKIVMELNKATGVGTIMIDINGDKNPNKYGRDAFGFLLSFNGVLYPAGSERWAGYYGDTYNWKNNTSYCGTPGSSVIPVGAHGWGCAARIIENGWVMDY